MLVGRERVPVRLTEVEVQPALERFAVLQHRHLRACTELNPLVADGGGSAGRGARPHLWTSPLPGAACGRGRSLLGLGLGLGVAGLHLVLLGGVLLLEAGLHEGLARIALHVAGVLVALRHLGLLLAHRRIGGIGRRHPPEPVRELVVELCGLRAWRAEELALLLSRKPETIRQDYLRPLLAQKRIAMTRPDKPRSPQQAYRSVQEGST